MELGPPAAAVNSSSSTFRILTIHRFLSLPSNKTTSFNSKGLLFPFLRKPSSSAAISTNNTAIPSSKVKGSCEGDNDSVFELSSLTALSPLDGRYWNKVKDLAPFMSEYGLIRYRVLVEIKWLLMLSRIPEVTEVPAFSDETQQYMQGLIDEFGIADALEVKSIEKVTNHDVKAIEYFLKEKCQSHPEISKVLEFFHFSCTSEDINNLAHALMLKEALNTVLFPVMDEVLGAICNMAKEYAHIPMLSLLDRMVSKLDSSRKKKNHVEKKYREKSEIVDQEKNSVTGSEAGVAGDIELLEGGDVHSREQGHVKEEKKKKKKNIKMKPDDNASDASFAENQTHHEVSENKKKNVNMGISGDDSQVKKKKKFEKCKDTEFADASDGYEIDNELTESIQSVKDKKTKKKKKVDLGAGSLDEELCKSTLGASTSDSKKFRDKGNKKRKEKYQGHTTEEDAKTGSFENDERSETAELLENSNGSKKSKKVKFIENVEVFPLLEASSKGKKVVKDGSEENENVESRLIHGKRFSKEEDDIIQDAVFKFIEDHQLGEEGVEMVMNCSKHRELKGCWKEIGQCLPRRPYLAVYTRAHILFERSEQREWTPEEMELVKQFHEKHGPDWKALSVELGKHRFHVKDAWRRIKLPNMKKGNWSQEEYQNLFNLVNVDLSMKAFTDKKTKHGMLRDNICWEAISDQLTTRTNAICCQKWYNSLTSPMVAKGEWANTDDYRLLMALVDLDATCEEDVDWDDLLEHRPGYVCLKRWKQMVRHIGTSVTKPFIEQVEILSQRYCANLLEAREAYDNKPPVD